MALKTTGFTDGKSNKRGFGGQSQQLKNAGVPGGVIGNLARKAGTAPGMKNFHGGKAKKKVALPSMKPAKAASPAPQSGGHDYGDYAPDDRSTLPATRR